MFFDQYNFKSLIYRQSPVSDLQLVICMQHLSVVVRNSKTRCFFSNFFFFLKLFSKCFYPQATSVSTPEEIHESVLAMRSMQGPVLLEIKVKKGSRKDLGRPTRSPLQNKADFMHFLAID